MVDPCGAGRKPPAYPARVLHPLPVPAGPDVLELLPLLERALAGRRPIVPYAAATAPPALPEPATPLPDRLAVVVATSGSTGTPKHALLTADAMTASATATHEVLGGPGSWLLAMPAHHVAGLQVLVRSVVAGTTPTVADLAAGFTPALFVEAARRHEASTASGTRRYTALVPTQVARLLDEPAAAAALAAYDGVLVGAAATPPSLAERAASAGVTLVPTYGMSETSGGCVYAGRPLPVSRVRIEDGRVLLGGATLASGYLAGDPAGAFVEDPAGSERWFRTDDAGHLDEDGRLHVDGRLDDLVTTGGLKVAPRVVEDALLRHVPGVREAVVVGAPDAEWGQVVSAALVVDTDGATRPPGLADVRSALRDALPAYALPRRLIVAADLPTRGPGKPDRSAIATWFTMGQ